MHLVMDEAIKRNRKVGVLIIDFEAQYFHTSDHIQKTLDAYEKYIEPFWVCLPIKLRNAASNFEPTWTCWDNTCRDIWVREFPSHDAVIDDINYFPFFHHRMEFEEFVVLFGDWYSQGKKTACFVGIRANESLNRFRTIAIFDKKMHNNYRWTTQVTDDVFNIYPIYDMQTKDIWIYHAKNKEKTRNVIYDLMHQAGVPLSHQRLCQPYGDDQRRGLWLYHILEPQTWYRVVARVNGANGMALYVQETGNITGYDKVVLPPGHTYKSFCNLLLKTLPKVSRDNYVERFRGFLHGWKERGYLNGIPDHAPRVLENKHWAPSWRRLCKVILRNDWWCKGLGLTQPKSEAYGKYLQIKMNRKSNNDGHIC
jgi:predicted phosphoadenosine phosphosulfate sulfurtransferase